MISVKNNIKEKLLQANEAYETWAVYGMGMGTHKILQQIRELKLEHKVVAVFGNAEEVKACEQFESYPVFGMEEHLLDVDVIIVGAEINHRMIYDKISAYLKDTDCESCVHVLDPFLYDVTARDQEDYLAYIHGVETSSFYQPLDDTDYEPKEQDSRIIAWYLPQFHQMEMNNIYHGQGFTEWTNTTRTIPQFTGHYQPHIPYDVGYYDLLNPETLKRQSYLARKYGIFGFGFFYYWFSGTRIMENPLDLLWEHKEIDMNYCIHWATDDWAMSWYGGNHEVILKQEIPSVDAFWKDASKYFSDSRYIKIDGRPLLVIYKCSGFEKVAFEAFLESMRQKAAEEGYPDLYIMISTGAGDFTQATDWGADALVEYQPWSLYQSERIENMIPEGYFNPKFRGYISDISQALENKDYLRNYGDSPYFRSAMTDWDNSARKKEKNAIVMTGNSPDRMKTWLIDIMKESKQVHRKSEDFVFISSWNEWAEGSHLEPDYKFGYAWLKAVRDALLESRTEPLDSR